jgi:lipoprotein-anchoring transpeptidase ErfK/SrfK
MLARFLAGAACAAGVLAAVCTPAAAQAFFSSMFGSSTGLGNGQALSYGIGVGRVGFTWSGVTRVSAKREWPDWTPPAQMRQRRPDLPRHMAGGVANPLGARAMYLGSSLYRIHGSNEPETIGQAVSSGCFRLTNDDVIDLYSRVRVGATVIVQH